MRNKTNKPYFSFWFWLIVAYLSFYNIFIFKFTPEVVVILFGILVFFLRRDRFKDFFTSWLPFIGLFLLYELLRGSADDVSPFYQTTLYWAYSLEKLLFPTIPTLFLQDIFIHNVLIKNVSFFFYSIFFYYSFFVAFLVWVRQRAHFSEYVHQFILMSFIGLVFFFLIPTAPPWLVAETHGIDVTRPTFGSLLTFRPGTLLYYFVYKNPVAAFPSLHVAWPLFSTLFLIKKNKHPMWLLLLVIPGTIGLSVIFMGEHFAVDVIAGYVLAVIIASSRWGAKNTT